MQQFLESLSYPISSLLSLCLSLISSLMGNIVILFILGLSLFSVVAYFVTSFFYAKMTFKDLDKLNEKGCRK